MAKHVPNTLSRVMALLVLSWGFVCAPGLAAVTQHSPAMPRLAAVRFAIENGWNLRDAVVIVESTIAVVDGTPIKQSELEQVQETSAIANFLGEGTKTGRARDYLTCPSPAMCFPAPGVSKKVLVVNRPMVGSSGVLVLFFTPASPEGGRETLTKAIIEVEQRSNGWSGIRYREIPKTLSRGR
jgi:hypothetical protein